MVGAIAEGELRIDGAGHWPWIERPSLVEEILDFLT
jgi:pimeloyl-ACP methyl ester carboxylesterase